jgi:hypothetical protein
MVLAMVLSIIGQRAGSGSVVGSVPAPAPVEQSAPTPASPATPIEQSESTPTPTPEQQPSDGEQPETPSDPGP